MAPCSSRLQHLRGDGPDHRLQRHWRLHRRTGEDHRALYVRLGFAVAVNVDPEILLVDEVIAVGDEEFQRRCMDHMNMLRERGTTILLVSHNATLMRDMCDTVGWLDHGRLMELGDPAVVVESYLDHVASGGDNTLTTRD